MNTLRVNNMSVMDLLGLHKNMIFRIGQWVGLKLIAVKFTNYRQQL